MPKFRTLAPRRELMVQDTELSVNLYINLRFSDGYMPDEQEIETAAERVAPALRQYWPDMFGVVAAHCAEKNEISLLVELPTTANVSCRHEAAACCCRVLAGNLIAMGVAGNA